MSDKGPGPLTRLKQRCDEMEAWMKKVSTLEGNYLNPVFMDVASFIDDVRKCADEIDQRLTAVRARISDKLQKGACKPE